MSELQKKIKIYLRNQGMLALIQKALGQVVFTMFYPIYREYLNKVCVNKKQVLFVSQPDFSDNSRTLYNYMNKDSRFEDYKFKWLVKEPHKYEAYDKRTEFIKCSSKWHTKWSIKALYSIMTSEYVFFSHTSPLSGLKRKDSQPVINLWHGCGYKSMKSTSNWLRRNPCDYSLVPGPVFVETKSIFFACPKEDVIPIGYPRFDEFWSVDENTKKFVANIKGKADKLLLWMPTYRKTELGQFAASKIQGFYELPILQSEDDVKRLNKLCEKLNVVICIKRHPLQIRYKCEVLKLSNIIFIDNEYLETKQVNLYGLLSCVEGLITDYSSVAIDYLLLDKPIAFTLDDFNEYGDTQGFVFENPLKYMPGNHIKTYSDLDCFLSQIRKGIDAYKADRHNIMLDVHNPCAGYCKRICDFFFDRTVEQLHNKEKR